MYKRKLLLTTTSVLLLTVSLFSQTSRASRSTYVPILDDANFSIGVKTVSIFALDDRAPLSANPHFEAMWNLVRLGAKLESLMAGLDEPLSSVSLDKQYGKNGYNKTTFAIFFRYGFGESSDVKLQKHFVELAVGPGYFKQGEGGINVHLDYQFNLFKTPYGAGLNSYERTFDYEIYVGARTGFDWSSQRSEGEAGFLAHLEEEIERVAFENEFSASDLIMLKEMTESTAVLLPKDAGGRAFHFGPTVGGRLSKKLFKNFRVFADGYAFYDVLDLAGSKRERENKRSQHHAALMLGLQLTIGSEGEVIVNDFF